MVVIKPDWAYFQLQADPAADLLTWRLLTSSLVQRYGGIHASAIRLDLLVTKDTTAIVRCPAGEQEYIQAALSGEVDGRSLRIVKVANFLPELLGSVPEGLI